MDENWESLIGRYLAGQLNDVDRRVLNERLRSDPAARRDFAEILNVDAALAVAAAQSGEHRSAGQRRHRFVWAGAVAAGLVVLLLAGWWLMPGSSQPYATVVSTMGADLGGLKSLRDEVQHLETGVVEFVTSGGTKVVVEAPATFRFVSARELKMEHGRVLAVVPPQDKGFTVLTPAWQIVDKGTEFGVDVAKDGTADVHVYKGEVVAVPKTGGESRKLMGGEAIRAPGDGSPAGAVSPAQNGRFIRPEMGQVKAAPATRGLGGGGLPGVLYDFKTDRNGAALPLDSGPGYASLVKKFVASGFSSASLEQYSQVSDNMSLKFLAVPVMNANDGPRVFSVDREVQSRGWLAHYRGTITPPENGEWRFAGYFDDVLAVFIDGRPVLDASREDLINAGATSPVPDIRQTFGNMKVLNGACYVGRWVNLTGPVQIDILVGERHGGQIGGLLLVEKKDGRYRMRENGTPLLPLFAAEAPDMEDLARVWDFAETDAAFGLELKKIPVFKSGNR